ncbi:hypothetical protein, partial [Sporosarcina sp. NPDC096371]|uniref:hypothetical protein n=1 Tax=Sporosarcina sp. NPDC096371 TaxID=3364530 RepID=UPI00380D150A
TIDSATQQVKMSSSAKDGQVITLTGKYEGLTATAEITVKDGSVKPTSIYFKETKLDMKPGETIGYQLIALMGDGSEEEVTSSGTYTRSNTYLAIDSATQQVKMSSSAKDGQVITLTGKYEGLTATAEITVKDGSAKPTNIYFKETKLDMKPGEAIGYQLMALMSDGSEEEVTSSGTYTRSNSYLTIDSATQQVKMSGSAKDGQVITLTGKYEGLTATAEITVKDGSVKPTSIYFKETKLDMKPGETAVYELIAILSDGSEEVVTSSGTYTRSNTYLTIDRAARQMKMSSSAKDGQVITLTGKYEGLAASAEITVIQ